jgi:hypothetical protein
LEADGARRDLLGLERVPKHRRMGEYLYRFGVRACRRLEKVSTAMASRIVPSVIEHELAQQGYIPVFVDGSGIEVNGDCVEQAGPLYDGSVGYWLHGIFIGELWCCGHLFPGGVDVAAGWREQLLRVAGLIGSAGPVWCRFDNAYYRKEVVNTCADLGFDYSVSVTNKTFKRPLLRQVEQLTYKAWKPINRERTEWATIIHHRPQGWRRKQSYLVIRKEYDDRQRRLFPSYVFILVSRDDLPLSELARRHRGKQGQENAFKGPLIHLDLHHPPCLGFHANQAFYLAGQIAQMLLVALKLRLLPKAAANVTIRTVIRDLVRIPGKIVSHARRLKLVFPKTCPRLDWIAHAADRIMSPVG